MKKTPLHAIHLDLGARMVEFCGWHMPLLYRGIVAEHTHTREAAGIFDVSHMGRLSVAGDGAQVFLERLCTRRIATMAVGQCRYSHVLNEAGGILDDVIVSRDEKHWLVVCNAGNRQKMWSWFEAHAPADVQLSDSTEATAMVAIQGPKTFDLLKKPLPVSLADLKRYHFLSGTYMMMSYAVSRTGYTGEDGIEVIFPAMAAKLVWPLIKADAKDPDQALQPVGLGARDTLRIEAGMPLYGQELTEQTDSLSASLGWCVDLTKEFIGADALRRIQEQGPSRKLVGLEIEGKRIARHGTPVQQAGKNVGEVTSGTLSPTLGKNIAMAYVDAALAAQGTELRVVIRDHETAAVVVPMPFYKRKK